MQDELLHDWLEQIDTITLELTEINFGPPMQETVQLQMLLVRELTILNRLVELQIRQLYGRQPRLGRFHTKLYIRGLIFATVSTLILIFFGVFIIPFVQEVVRSL